jgi:hypothetical protein
MNCGVAFSNHLLYCICSSLGTCIVCRLNKRGQKKRQNFYCSSTILNLEVCVQFQGAFLFAILAVGWAWAGIMRHREAKRLQRQHAKHRRPPQAQARALVTPILKEDFPYSFLEPFPPLQLSISTLYFSLHCTSDA